MLGSVLSCGAYVPRLRLPRAAIQDAMGWLARPNERREAGARAVCNWDEDALTLGVEAARSCLAAASAVPAALTLASTTLPFADRSNATLLAAALDLPKSCETLDVTGTLRAGTTALAQSSRRADAATTLLVATDARSARPGSEQELQFGAAAVALLLAPGSTGAEHAIAHLRAATHVAADFVDHYRMSGVDFDYTLEERWVRDEGIGKLAPEAISAALQASGLSPADVRHLLLPLPRVAAQRLTRAVGLEGARLGPDLREDCGEAGAAHPLLMLAAALEYASPGEPILLLGFGQGVDVLVFEAARQPERAQRALTLALARRREETSYTRYLAHRGLLRVDFGMRSERDNRSAPSVMWRKERQVAGFVGGRCGSCGTLQFPRSRVCVNPECRKTNTQADFRLADTRGRVKTFTEDWQAYTPRPPLVYGNVEFEGGGNLLMELTDTEPGEVQVGMPVRFAFRIKDVDPVRAFRRYFWKATGA
jgi:hydroxymethylglutaryl-CoA synthase